MAGVYVPGCRLDRCTCLVAPPSSQSWSRWLQRSAQQADVAAAFRAQIDRIYTQHAYDRAAIRAGAMALRRDGIRHRRAQDGAAREIARYDAATWLRGPCMAGTKLDVDDYAWSSDGRRPAGVHQHEESVASEFTRGDYWRASNVGGQAGEEARRLGA